MSIAIIHHTPSLSRYAQEILRAWGLRRTELIEPSALDGLQSVAHPVTICPKVNLTESQVSDLERYAHTGGTVIAICPSTKLAQLAGVTLSKSERTGSLRMRVHGLMVRGLQGESLPIVGDAQLGEASDSATLASLYVPGELRGEDHESPAIVSSSHGQGRIIGVLFDLPRCVMTLRQGEPVHADRQFASESITRRSCKPTNLAADIGPDDSGQIPFADLLGRVLVDLVLDAVDLPMPLVSTIPAGAAGVLLMSGDEDNAEIQDIDRQMTQTTETGGRMNLYMIPNLTHSTPEDTQRYRQTHDLGPHPDLVPMCDAPPQTRVAEYERQIRQFEDLFGVKARSVRNHAAGWVGYLDLVAVQECLGIRMDANYFSGGIFRERNQAPFSPFGGALPMRFTEPDGRLYDVFQQHTQLNDDVWFAPDRPYSYKFNEAVAKPMMQRILDQLAGRFRMPLTCNFHPGNWYFASGQAMALMRMAKDRGMVCWSLDQWLAFWEARDACRLNIMIWNGNVLKVEADLPDTRDDLCIELPIQWRDKTLQAVSNGGEALTWNTHPQYEGDLARVRIPASHNRWAFEARYA